MKEAPISQSPYVIDPEIFRDEKEAEKLYKLRIDETYRSYTVFDVLTKVFRRSYSDDLLSYIGEHPEEFKSFEAGWKLSRAWVNELCVLRSEAGFFQAHNDFLVDIVVEARIKLEETRKDGGIISRRESLKGTYCLRYSFDFTPCRLLCRFVKVVTKKEEFLETVLADSLRLDKYLLPVMQSKDYTHLAELIHRDCYPDAIREDVKIDPLIWIDQMERTVRCGVFPENGALGEYFFGFGTADIVDHRTGEIRNEKIAPGTIILNWELTKSAGIMNSTLAHEATHAFLGKWFFRLQMTHGHDYCSYMCKKSGEGEEFDYRSPLERMEIQANTLPRYLLIPDANGKKHVEKLLGSYGGERSLENMRRLVDDMAAYYGTTKTMARTRLMDFGYNEARGILRSANGKLVPAYYSMLQKNETYSISEKEAIEEYIRNSEFRDVLNSGRYLYVRENACFCLNDSKYLYLDHVGRPHLRRYARENMGECCLVFRTAYVNAVVRLVNGVLQKDASWGKGRKKICYVGVNGESPVTEEGLKLRRQIEKQMADKAAIDMSFNDMTIALMEKKRISVGKLAELTGLSDDTIKNMRNKSDIAFPIREVVAVCIAMHLAPVSSGTYIAKSPTKFLDSVEMRLYEYALNQWYMDSVPKVNRRLVEAGVPPLTSLVEGYDESGMKIAN